jgi:hypothetical protein
MFVAQISRVALASSETQGQAVERRSSLLSPIRSLIAPENPLMLASNSRLDFRLDWLCRSRNTQSAGTVPSSRQRRAVLEPQNFP